MVQKIGYVGTFSRFYLKELEPYTRFPAINSKNFSVLFLDGTETYILILEIRLRYHTASKTFKEYIF